MTEREAIVARALMTPKGQGYAMGFHGTWAEVKARWAFRLWVDARRVKAGFRVLDGGKSPK